MSKKKLGRGLEALFSPVETVSQNSTEKGAVVSAKVRDIFPNKYQPRRHFNAEKLQELCDSIVENGIIQPLIVTPRAEGRFEIIAGERRLQAAKMANFDEVPIVVRDASDKQMLQIAIIENIQRENLNPIEEAQGYERLKQEFKYTHAEIGKAMGKDRTTISNFLRILSLDEIIKKMILDGIISMGHAKVIMQAEESKRVMVAQKVVDMSMSVRVAENYIRSLGKNKRKKVQKDFSMVESKLKKIFKTKVKIKGGDTKGSITFTYLSQKQKNFLLNLLTNE